MANQKQILKSILNKAEKDIEVIKDVKETIQLAAKNMELFIDYKPTKETSKKDLELLHIWSIDNGYYYTTLLDGTYKIKFQNWLD